MKLFPYFTRHHLITHTNTPLVKFTDTKPHPGLEWRIFISSLVRISMLSLISSLPLKFYLNSLVYDRNIFESSSNVFGNLRTFSENVRQRSCVLRTSFEESSEIFGKWSEIFGKSSKTLSCITKRTLHVSPKIPILLFLPLEHKIRIFSPRCNILYIWFLA